MFFTTTRRTALAAGCLLAIPAIVSAQFLPLEPRSYLGDPAAGQFAGAVHHAADGSALAFWEQSGIEGSMLLAQRHRGWVTPVAPRVTVSEQVQGASLVALDAVDGAGWVAAWDRFEPASGAQSVRARDFDAQDQATGPEYEINTLPGRHWQPDVAFSADGTRAFVWMGATDGGPEDVYARVFRADGAMPAEVKLNLGAAMGAEQPQVVRLANGDFLAAWTGMADGVAGIEILARRFDAQGNLIDEPFLLSDAGGSHENNPRLAVDATGMAVVAWQGDGAARLRRLHADGRPDGSVFEAPREPGDDIDMLDLALDADGDIALGYILRRDDTYSARATFQRFTADGTPAPRQELVWSPDAINGDPRVSSDVDGDVFMTWRESTWDWSTNDYQQRVTLQHIRTEAPVDLSLSFTDNQVSAAAGEMLGYIARVRHEGVPTGVPGEGDTGMFAVTVTLPEHAVVDHIYEMDWTCSEPSTYSPQSVSCLFDEKVLTPGEVTYPFVVYARLPSWASDVTATARVSAIRHLDPDTSNDSASDRTWIGDTQPDAFPLLERTGVSRSALQASVPFAVAGIDVPVEITVSNGEYRIDDGPWTSEPGVIDPYRTVSLRHTTSPEFSTRTRTWFYIGTRGGAFETVTEAIDGLPDAFAFADATGVARGALVTSNLITITGINTATPIGVSGGSFSINGGTWRTHSGHAYQGDTVRVQHTASSAFGTRTDTVLTVGAVSDTFSSTTVAADSMPDAFAFASQGNVARSATVTSAAVTITGINTTAPISIVGGSYSIGGGPWTSAPGVVTPNAGVRVQHVASAAFGTATTSTLTVGGVSAGFTSTTEAADTVPNAFAFVDVSAKKKSVVTSAPVTITGINTPAAVTVSAGGKWSKNGGAFTTAAGSVSNGDVVRLQATAATSAGAKVNIGLSVGGVGDTWTITSTN